MSDMNQCGTSRPYLLSRLRAERPDLAVRVDTGQMSVYSAGCEAGMCKPRYGPNNPQCTARDPSGLDCAGPAGHADGSSHANLNGSWS